MPAAGLQKPPSCWAVLSQDRVTIVLLAVGQDLYLLDNTSCSVVTPPGMSPSAGAYLQMAVSFNYRCLALFTDTGYIWMGLATLKEKLCEFNCSLRAPPKQMVWCMRPRSRQRAVVMAWDRQLMVVGNSTECIQYPLGRRDWGRSRRPAQAPRAAAAPSSPGCRCPQEAQRSPGGSAGSERSGPLVRLAELRGPSPALLRGSPLSLRVPPRLVLRRLYPLAIRICEYLRLSEIQGVSRILAHWACYKVQQKDKSDEEVAYAINQKLGDTPGISYSEIAARAYDCGRTELAIKLLEYEPRSGEQVPLLLKMKRSKLALSKAIESGDTDLVYTVVLHLKNELNRGTFFMTLQNQPVALSLYRQFCKHQERETLKDLYNQDDNHQELGNFHVHSSYSEKRIEGRVAALQNAVDEYYKAKNEFAAKATEDQIKLLRLQRHLQEDFDKPYLDLSLHDTVSTLILDGHHKKAEQLYRDFKIPDKRYWWLKINALATRGDWEEMEKFSKSKKSPIGYLPFVEIAVKHHNRYEAKKYAPRVTPEQRVKAFILVGCVGAGGAPGGAPGGARGQGWGWVQRRS
uniref:Vacuolar protein sorting-associated protein 16 homolog n=1 Tax=Cairina moschata TaxID=8855 RepID=A0A8C3BTT5_CAIMO